MFDPAKELALAIAGVVGSSLWCYFDPSAEARAAIGLAVAATIAASIHLAYRMGTESISDQERTDAYLKQKSHLERAKKRLAREKPNLDQLADNPKSAAGNKHTETTPFELLQEELYPLRNIKGYGKLTDKILKECKLILSLPSGSRYVSTLMPLLKKLDKRLSAKLQEENIWR